MMPNASRAGLIRNFLADSISEAQVPHELVGGEGEGAQTHPKSGLKGFK